MKVKRKVGYVLKSELREMILMKSPGLGPYLIRVEDYESRVTQNPIRIYPVVREDDGRDMVCEFLAKLSEQDYEEQNVKRDFRK